MKRFDPDARAAELFLEFPEPPAVLPPVRLLSETNGVCTTAPTLPYGDGRLQYRGRVGQEVSLDQARAAVRLATIQALAILKAHYGKLAQIRQILQLRVSLVAIPDFRDHLKTLDSASQLLGDLFGAHGTHARSAVGVASLPEGACAAVELVVALQ